MEKSIFDVLVDPSQDVIDEFLIVYQTKRRNLNHSSPTVINSYIVNTRVSLFKFFESYRELYAIYRSEMVSNSLSESFKHHSELSRVHMVRIVSNVFKIIMEAGIEKHELYSFIQSRLQGDNVEALYNEGNFIQTLISYGDFGIMFRDSIPLLRLTEHTFETGPKGSGCKELGVGYLEILEKVSNHLFLNLVKLEVNLPTPITQESEKQQQDFKFAIQGLILTCGTFMAILKPSAMYMSLKIYNEIKL
jgi:hypothetical protein